MSFLGLDIGAVLCRAVAVNAHGVVLARAQRRHGPGSAPGDCQLDARAVWEAVRRILVQMADQTRADPISALAISAPGDAIVPLSLEGEPLMPCILGTDLRGSGYLNEAIALLSPERFFDLTGRLNSAPSVVNRLCWIRDHAPGVYRNTALFSTLGGFIAQQLGASGATDRTQASVSHLLDINQLDWSPEMLRACGLAAEKMPEVRPAGAALGPLASPICRDLGLTGRPVAFLGADDLACLSLGSGVVRPGQTMYHLGTRFCLAPLYEAIPIRRLLYLRGLETAPHLPVGLLTTPVRYATGGSSLSWFLDVLSPLERREALRGGQNPYHRLLLEMPPEPSPVLAAPPEEGGVGLIWGLSTANTRGELVRAVLEGLALQTVEGQQRLLDVGIPLEVYRATGGGSRSGQWLQITADVTGYPVERTAEEQTATLGAAIVAAHGSGAFASLTTAVEALVRVVDRYEPDPERQAHYRLRLAQLATLRQTSARLADASH
jgi:xylulokinase